MRRISIAIALAILLFASLCTAQQTASNASTNSELAGSPTPPPGPIIGGMGTANYIPIWATPNFLLSSVIYQTSGGNLGIGTTSPTAKLDVNGSINAQGTYMFGGASVLSATPFTGSGGNLSVGLAAGSFGASTYYNISVGNSAGGSGTTFPANYNVFLGSFAGLSDSTGGDNTFLGSQSGYLNTTGTYNTFVGFQAGAGNTTGQFNAYLGWQAGGSEYGTTTGSDNTFLGATAGDNNGNETGNSNTFIGFSAGSYNWTGNNNIYIGNLGCTYPCGESSTIRIGGDIGSGYGPQTAAYIAGIYGSTSSGGIPVYINSNGRLGTTTSSLRFKEQVRDMGDSTSALMKLRPVTFLYKPEYAEGKRTLQYGLIAEEVANVYPELVAYDKDGQPYTVRYQYLSTMLLNEVQKQYRRAEAEAQVIQTQEQKIEQLEQRLSRLEALVGSRVNSAEAIANVPRESDGLR